MPIDRKYKILAINPVSGNIHTEDDAVLFTARDVYLVNVLDYYHDMCKRGGADKNHLESISLLIQRVADHQQEHGSHLPDTDLPGEIRRCIHGDLDE